MRLMITLREVLVFLAPAVFGGAVAVLVFQIIDRLNVFYQTNSQDHRAAEKTGRAAAA
jgi:hypothetical protein